MNQLLVRTLPKNGQSVGCYLKCLATENGYDSLEFMIQKYLNVVISNTDQISQKMVADLTGHSHTALQALDLLPSEQHFQPTHWYGKLAIPSYHLRKEQWVCPHCVNEDKYSLAKWRIAWLPVCLKHQMPLVQADKLIWHTGIIVDFTKAANDEFYDDRILQLQKLLEKKLEIEWRGAAKSVANGSILEEVEKHLFRGIGAAKAAQLQDRKRKYAKRYFPLLNRDIPKFMECLFTQLME